MPLYEYRCKHCGTQDERNVPMAEVSHVIQCTGCGRDAHRVYSTPTIHFKDSGFYNTDYRQKKHHGAKEDTPTPQETKEKADAGKGSASK